MTRRTGLLVAILAVLALAAGGFLLLSQPAERRAPAPEKSAPAPAPPTAEPEAPPPPPVDLSAVDRERDVFGSVHEPSGPPVAGAKLTTFLVRETATPLTTRLATGDFGGLPAGPATTSATDGSFRFTLPPGESVHLLATAPGYLDALLSPVRAGERIEVLLRRPSDGPALALLVGDGYNMPARGARVQLLEWREGRLALVRRGVTDRRGIVALAALLPGPATVRVAHDDFEGRSFTVVLPESGTVHEEIVLSTGPLAIGRVVDATGGAPIAGAEVTVGEPPRRRVTDAEGRFSFPNFTRPLDLVSAEAPGYARGSSFVALGGETVIRLLPEVRVRGRLVDGAGRGIAGGLLHAEGFASGEANEAPSSMDVRAETAADGTFTLPGLRDGATFTLTAAAPGYGTRVFTFDSSALPGPARDKDAGDLVLPEGRTVRGVVLDAADRPVPGIWVRAGFLAEPAALGGAAPKPVLRSPASRRALTDDLGRFLLTGLAPGDYELATEAGDRIPARQRVTVGEATDPPDVVLRLGAGLAFAVTVLDPDGRPLPGARVNAEFVGDGCSGLTDAAGQVRFTGLPEDLVDIALDVRPPEGPGDPVVMRTRWTVAAALGRATIPLRRVAWIDGECVDPDGKPIPAVGIRVQTAAGELAGVSGLAGPTGKFHLMCAEGAVVNLGFFAGREGPAGAARPGGGALRAMLFGVTAPRRDLRVVLSPVREDLSVQVTVLDGDERPVPGAEVRIEGAVAAASGTTGADGRVSVENVEGGLVFLSVAPAPGTVSPLIPTPHFEAFDSLEKRDLVVRLRPGQVVTGRVVGPDSAPLAGVKVFGGHQFMGRDATAVSDSEGRFTVLVPRDDSWFLTAFWSDANGVYYVGSAKTPPGTTEVEIRMGRGER